MLHAPRLDAANIAGITSLMNPQNIKQGVDLEKIEKDIMGKKEERNKHYETDPVKLYTQELNQLAEDLGIELFDDDGQMDNNRSGPVGGNFSSMVKPIKLSKYSDDFDDTSGSSRSSKSSRSSRSSGYSRSSRSSRSSGSSGSSGSLGSSGSSGSSGSYSDSRTSGSYSSDSGSYDSDEYTDDSESTRSRRHRRDKKKYSRHLDPIPENRQHINNVVSNIRNDTFTAVGEEREKIRDSKASKLEQIGQLRLTLEDEGIDCSSVTKPNMDSPMDEIDAVINILRLKNDRNRYSTIAEEVILGIAEGIETVFDGSRRIPLLGWRPDYTGYHNTVNVKLHRMRFETSQVVGAIIEKHKIGSSARIALELLPSFLLYPRQQKMQKQTPSLYDKMADNTIDDARGAYNSIRKAEEKQSLYDALDI